MAPLLTVRGMYNGVHGSRSESVAAGLGAPVRNGLLAFVHPAPHPITHAPPCPFGFAPHAFPPPLWGFPLRRRRCFPSFSSIAAATVHFPLS